MELTVMKLNGFETSMSTRLQNHNRMDVFSIVYPNMKRRCTVSRMPWFNDHTIFLLFYNVPPSAFLSTKEALRDDYSRR